MNIILFLFIQLIIYILLIPNFLIKVPPEDLEWFSYKSYIVKNRLKLSVIFCHSILYLFFLYIVIKFLIPKMLKRNLNINNFKFNNFKKNVELI